jgi:SAM-dependent methyltransferase
VARYYAEKLATHGSGPRGVDWSTETSQQLRLTQLLALMRDEAPCAILDYGCGYGTLAKRLITRQLPFRYVGFDVCQPMIDVARAAVLDERCVFTGREDELAPVDYTLASGVFNVKLQASQTQWQAHVLATLDTLCAYSRAGFAFNLLSRYADPELMRDHLYYGDPGWYFKLCKERYSRNVSLLHDYELYEFTVLVRLGAAPKPLTD